MMSQYLKCLFSMSAAIILIQLFSTFGFSKGSELPLALMQNSVNANGAKSRDYARRMAFPLAPAEDNEIELPPHVEDNSDFSSAINEEDLVEQENGGMPKWLQMQLQTDNHHQHGNNYPANMLHKQSNKQQQQQQQQYQQHQHHAEIRQAHAVSTTPLRRCSIEITNKIPGICQSMGTIGNACVSGEYLDVFNADCF